MESELADEIARLLHEERMEGVEIEIVHRGGEDDRKVLEGEEIEDLEKRFMITEDGTGFPYTA